MSRLGAWLRDVLQTAFRLAPWPTEAGLRRVGNPDVWSPVVVTGNYDLTVRRVERALRGVDAWLVVAPSGGINVWCAAAGGHLGTAQVVTALKTSGIEDRVRHRHAILPQLAATGVRARDVGRRCGWRVRFGPVDARDLPRYLAGDGHKSDDMRRVRFGIRERLEMACAWAVPSALLVGTVLALVRPSWTAPVVVQCAALAAGVFLAYERLPAPRPLVFGALALVGSAAVAWLAGGGSGAVETAMGCAVLFTAVLTFDYPGSTPTAGASFFEQTRWHIQLDLERCKGVYSCWEVCPEACFEKRPETRQVALAHDDRCVRCGACVVQCPQDALFFEDAEGRRVPPESVRRFKLNLLGRRAVDAGAAPESDSATNPMA